ncbi:hypothetical protein KHS38_09565 [Mucilaginibacter sp. Bleaf8]|uniref:hypothetical protein n=1 Tax=Mucilaginibacter sp. Bleaf8 TaxID=2834430 RepID=UPI001BCE069A|nr:hypothetical protein [Mucilaginibacter sp. Bleaf8]MBS7564654.1 hypothetical protein [Mucilaginibacter sp. Bleaf8]
MMKKIALTTVMAALLFCTGGAWAQSQDKQVQSQKSLKNNTANTARVRTDQGVPFNPTGTHGAGATATTKDSGQQKKQISAQQKTKERASKNKYSKKAGTSNKKKTVNNPGVDSQNGH